MRVEAVLRLAVQADGPAVAELARASVLEVFPAHYDPATEPARIGAMFVRADWTRRGLGRAILTACTDAARAEGFTKLALMSTLPGVPLYKAFGFTEVEAAQLPMPDGTVLAGVAMERPIEETA